MAKYVSRTYRQILQRMINTVVARSDLSDLNDASVFKHIVAAVAREIDEVYFTIENKLNVFSFDKASGDDLDERAKDVNPDAISRKLAVASTGVVTFSTASPNTGPPIPIPAGTAVEVPGESPAIVAVTTAAATIGTGNTSSGNVPAAITDAGQRGNVAPNQLTKFKGAKPSGVDAVTNPSSFVGGQDKETDDAFRDRIKAHIRALARCTPSALEFAATEVSDPATGASVVFARTVESQSQFGLVTLFIDDGTGAAETTTAVTTPEILTTGTDFPGNVAQGGETTLFTANKPLKDEITPVLVRNPGNVTLVRDDAGANGYTLNPATGQIQLNTPLIAGDSVTATYTYFTGLIQLTQKVIDGDPNDRANFPGHRAAGVLVKVRTPTPILLTIAANITVLDGFDQNTVAEEVRAELAAYVNALGIGNDVIVSEIIERAMAVAGMFDIAVTTPAANVTVLEDQLPRINDAASDIVIN